MTLGQSSRLTSPTCRCWRWILGVCWKEPCGGWGGPTTPWTHPLGTWRNLMMGPFQLRMFYDSLGKSSRMHDSIWVHTGNSSSPSAAKTIFLSKYHFSAHSIYFSLHACACIEGCAIKITVSSAWKHCGWRQLVPHGVQEAALLCPWLGAPWRAALDALQTLRHCRQVGLQAEMNNPHVKAPTCSREKTEKKPSSLSLLWSFAAL